MNNIDDAKMETSGSSGSSDSFLPLKKRIRLNNEPDNALIVASATEMVAVSGDVKYKGVVQQPNGHWGAQIYAYHKRIWLGTFNSAAEAAMAYDSASIKLLRFDAKSHRNFPWSKLTVQEPDFQNGYTTEDVLDMIKDHSYQDKFRKFLSLRSETVASINIGGSKVRGEGDQESNKCLPCKQLFLFQKELTPSDVGKLNRLVIPKKNAVKYMPLISEDQKEREEGEIGGSVKDVEVEIYDTAKTQWTFRYCYWKSSQSFVFTRGWNGFVKAKNLKEKDVIAFYSYVPNNVKTLEGQSKNSLMIDVKYFSENSSVVPEGVSMTVLHDSSAEGKKTENFVSFSSKLRDEETKYFSDDGSVVPEELSMTVHDSSAEGKKTAKFVSFSPKLRDEETKSEEKKGRSIMLLGVRIQCS